MSSVEPFGTHYELFRRYLKSFLLDKGATLRRVEKLSAMSFERLEMLSADVYDEINRRLQDNPDVPFLTIRRDFSQSRNQARQKLGTQPSEQFKVLASQVFFELERRFPQMVDQYDARYGALDARGPTLPRKPTYEQSREDARSRSRSPNRSPPNVYTQPPPIPSSTRTPTTTTGRVIPKRGASRNVLNTNGGSGLDGRSRDRGRVDANGMLSPLVTAPRNLERENMERERREREQSAFSGRSDEPMRSATVLPNAGRSGSMGRVSPAGPRPTEELERLQAEVVKLRRQLKDPGPSDEVKRLQDELAAEKKANKELKQKYDLLLNDYDSIKDDLKAAQRDSDTIRQERNALLEDVQTLSQKNQKLKEEKERDADIIRRLQEELGRAGDEAVSVAPSTPRTRMDSAKGDLFLSSESSDDPRILAYQDAAERLVFAARAEDSRDILVAMKSVVLTVKAITEEAERLESQSADEDDLTDLENGRDRVSDSLSALLGIAKDQASRTRGDVGIVEDGVRAVDDAIRDLVAVIKRVNPSTQTSDNTRTLTRRTSVALGVTDLKIFIEDQTDTIVTLIQTLVTSLKTSPARETQDVIAQIQTAVDDILYESNRTTPMLDSDTRAESEAILDVLDQSVKKLGVVGEELGRQSGAGLKAVKQRIGNTSFEVAKHVKDLLGVFE